MREKITFLRFQRPYHRSRFDSILLHLILLHLHLEVLRDLALLAFRALRVEHEADRALAAALAGPGPISRGRDGCERVMDLGMGGRFLVLVPVPLPVAVPVSISVPVSVPVPCQGGRLPVPVPVSSVVLRDLGGGGAVNGDGVGVFPLGLLLPVGEAGQFLRVGFLVQGDADREELFDGVVGADDGGAAVVGVEFEEVEEGF